VQCLLFSIQSVTLCFFFFFFSLSLLILLHLHIRLQQLKIGPNKVNTKCNTNYCKAIGNVSENRMKKSIVHGLNWNWTWIWLRCFKIYPFKFSSRCVRFFEFGHLSQIKVSSLCKALISLTFLRMEKFPKKMRQDKALFCSMLLGQSEMISLLAETGLNRCMRVTAYLV